MRTYVRSRRFGVSLGPVATLALSPFLLLYVAYSVIAAPVRWLCRRSVAA
ncbi:MAG TPA: hypothetical protein VGP33_06630 [Chloroflexota bacterium]|jgi:hypothetical protein|nr:hypothetical protein [Chloroflexota bacterium]